MKRLLAIGLLCLMFLGCSESPVDESGRHVAERNGTNEFNVVLYSGSGKLTFLYIMIDGHEYVLMLGSHISGLTHSPKCQCLKNRAEIVLPLNTMPPLNAITNEMTQVVPL